MRLTKPATFSSFRTNPSSRPFCASNPDRAKSFADKWGYESVETDWRKVVESPDIDIVDIASPNDTHAEIAVTAAKAGKIVMCEKPLGRNPAESEAMVEGRRRRGRSQLGLVQLPPRSGRHVGETVDRRRPLRPDLPLSDSFPAGLDHYERPPAAR
jgi:hypothetical protein